MMCSVCITTHLYSSSLLIHFPSRRNSDQSDSPSEPTKPVLRKHGKLITFFRWETEYKSFQFLNSQELHLVTAGSWEAEKARDLAGESLWLRPRRTSSQFWQRRWIYSPPHLFLRLCLLLKPFERKKGLKFRNEQECASGPIYLYARLINWARLIVGKRNVGGDHLIVLRLNSTQLQERMLISQKDLVSQGMRKTNTSAVRWFVMNKLATLNNRCITLCEYWALSFSDVSSWERQ